MFIKICGMTRRQDIERARDLGVDAVGIIFAPSPRRVTPKQARTLTDGLTGVLKVGVFVNERLEVMTDIRKYCGLDMLQLHGDESPELCAQLGGALIKGLRVKDESVYEQMSRHPRDIIFLLDAFSSKAAGGTGTTIDGALLGRCPDFSRVILAGGVGPVNAEELIRRYRPFGLDANSRLEVSPGVKDHEAMRQFVATVRNVSQVKRLFPAEHAKNI